MLIVFYCINATLELSVTLMQILDKNMEPIKGLYAVGNDSEGFLNICCIKN
ncbi:hypothetical protein [Clostridium felsineum]|uniref:hypothetical protein n=1 Tax=Clostridium felsineum TaxID=36839 RepID=UPI0020337EA8|nr:hypothetical protein [Clostridium felsineum]